MRIVKWLSFIVLGLLAVAVVLILVVPNVLDWNRFKPQIADAARQATGRDLRIDGDIRISMWPNLDFSLAGVHLANAPGVTQPEMVTVSKVTGKIELWPLLRHELVVDTLVVDGAAIHLAVDRDGNPNWAFSPPAGAAQAPKAPAAESAPSGSPWGLSLGDLRITGSSITYQDATTGQSVETKDIAFATAMTDPARPLSITSQMTVNALPVSLDLLVETPSRLLEGQKANVKFKLASARVNMVYTGTAQQKPVPGLDGVFDLDVPSAGQLAAWLGRPLSQPDPGLVKVHAEFAADGAKTVLKQVAITGGALSAKASGSLDASGHAPKLTLQVESGVLDVDRYLPPPSKVKGPAVPQSAASRVGTGDAFSSIPNGPIDLSWLQAAEVNVNVAIAGVKAMGYQIGKVALTAQAKGGVLTADLNELSLYGGKITGKLKLDGAGKAVALQSSLNVDRVKLDDLAHAASAGALPVTGVASASLDVAAQGTTPRALAEGVHGRLALDLGGMEVRNAPAGAVSGIKMTLDLPGADQPPLLQGSVVYNKQQVDLALKLDALKQVVSGKPFAASTTIKSELATFRYDGKVIPEPAPGLDGKLGLDIPSFGRLAAWLGAPLPVSEPDPGPLKIQATFTGENTKLALKDATVEGKALKAKASAAIDRQQKVPTLTGSLEITDADLNAYFPPEKAPAPPSARNAQGGAAPRQAAPAAWSDAPLDLAALSSVNGEFTVKVASTKYRELKIDHGTVKMTLSGGVLKSTLDQLALAQGTIDGAVTVDGSSANTAKLTYQIAIAGVESQNLLKSFAGSDRLSGKLAFKTDAAGSGRSQKQIIESLNGTGQFKFTDGAIHGINLAEAVRQVRSLGTASSESEKTDFAELSGTYQIKNGLLENKDLQMLAPLIRLTGDGTVDLPKQTVDYRLEAKLVGTIQGQGGEQALAGLPIPVKVTGPWTAPSYNIDWQSVLQEAAKDPQRLKQLPGQLQNMAKGMNIPGLGGQQGTGSGSPLPGGLSIPGLGSSGSSGPSSGTPSPGAQPQQPAQNPKSGTGNILKSIPGFSPQ